MTKNENNNLHHVLYRMAGQIIRENKKGNKEFASGLFAGASSMAYNMGLDFCMIQIEYNEDHNIKYEDIA